jgi:hypothetical protein
MSMDRSHTGRRWWVGIALSLALGAVAPSCGASSATSAITATAVRPIGITETVALSFGKFASGASGTVTVKLSGAVSASNGVLLLGGTPHAGSYQISGEPEAAFSISYGVSALSRDSSSMTLHLISAFSPAANATGAVAAGALGLDGTATLHIGGTLDVGPNQATGSYSGTVSVAVEYN